MEKKYVDFVKCLEVYCIVKKGSHRNKKVMETIRAVCNMTEEQIRNEKDISVIIIHDEYTDWLETYNTKKYENNISSSN